MASHSGAVTVEVAPADSAVSVVGTGVELGARPEAIVVMVGCAECAIVSRRRLVMRVSKLSRRGLRKGRRVWLSTDQVDSVGVSLTGLRGSASGLVIREPSLATSNTLCMRALGVVSIY